MTAPSSSFVLTFALISSIYLAQNVRVTSALATHGAPCPCIGKEQLKALREERKRLEVEWRRAEDLLRREREERGKLQRLYAYLMTYLPKQKLRVLPTPTSKGVYYNYDVLPPTPASPSPSKKPKPIISAGEREKHQRRREKRDEILRDLRRLYEEERNLERLRPTAIPYVPYTPTPSKPRYYDIPPPPPAARARIIARKNIVIKDIEEEIPNEQPPPLDSSMYEKERKQYQDKREAMERKRKLLEEQRLAAEKVGREKKRQEQKRLAELERRRLEQERLALEQERKNLQEEKKRIERLRKDEEKIMPKKPEESNEDLEIEKRRMDMLAEKIRFELKKQELQDEKDRLERQRKREQEEEARRQLEEKQRRLAKEENRRKEQERQMAEEAERKRIANATPTSTPSVNPEVIAERKRVALELERIAAEKEAARKKAEEDERRRVQREKQRVQEEKERLDRAKKEKQKADLAEQKARAQLKQKLEAAKAPKVHTTIEVRVEKKPLTDEIRQLQLEQERMDRELAALENEPLPKLQPIGDPREDKARKEKQVLNRSLKLKEIAIEKEQNRLQQEEDKRRLAEVGMHPGIAISQTTTQQAVNPSTPRVTSTITTSSTSKPSSTIIQTPTDPSSTITSASTVTAVSNPTLTVTDLERRRLIAEQLRKQEEEKLANEKAKLAQLKKEEEQARKDAELKIQQDAALAKRKLNEAEKRAADAEAARLLAEQKAKEEKDARIATEKKAAQDAEMKRQAELLSKQQVELAAQQVQSSSQAAKGTAVDAATASAKGSRNSGQVAQLQETGLVVGTGSNVPQSNENPANSANNDEQSALKSAADQAASELANLSYQELGQASNLIAGDNQVALENAILLQKEAAAAKEDGAKLKRDEPRVLKLMVIPAKPLTNEEKAGQLQKENERLINDKNNIEVQKRREGKELAFLKTQPKNATIETKISVLELKQSKYDDELKMLELEMLRIERELAWMEKEIDERARQVEASGLKDDYAAQLARINDEIKRLESELNGLASQPNTPQNQKRKSDLERQRSSYIMQWEQLQPKDIGVQSELQWLDGQKKASKSFEGEDRKAEEHLLNLRRQRQAKDANLAAIDRELATILRTKPESKYTPSDKQKFVERNALEKAIAALRKQEIALLQERINLLNRLITAKYVTPPITSTKKYISSYTPVSSASTPVTSSISSSASIPLAPSPSPSPKPTVCGKVCQKNKRIQKAIEKKRADALEAKRLKDLEAAKAAQKKQQDMAKAAELKKELSTALREKRNVASQIDAASQRRNGLQHTINIGEGTPQTTVDLNALIERIRQLEARRQELLQLEQDLQSQILKLIPEQKPKKTSGQVDQLKQTGLVVGIDTAPATITAVSTLVTTKTPAQVEGELKTVKNEKEAVGNQIDAATNKRNQLQHTINIGQGTPQMTIDLNAIIERIRRLEARRLELLQLEKDLQAELLAREKELQLQLEQKKKENERQKRIAALRKKREELEKRKQELLKNQQHVTVITKKKVVDGKVVETTEERRPGIHQVSNQG